MRLVIVSCPPQEADSLLTSLLQERLVGCGNILPGVKSRYWWEGRICEDQEALIFMETEEEKVPALLARIPQLHSYEVPKVLVLAVGETLGAYAGWLRAVIAG
ncbi:MAG: divalent-cation tolerance protein CutA [Pseudomonadota bacterium]